jgi:hypothetical protein
MPPASLPSSSSLTDGQITTADNNPVHDDGHTMTMIKTKGKPAREAQRRLTGEEIGSWTALKTKIEGGFLGKITLAADFNCNYNSVNGEWSVLNGRIDIVYGQDVTIHDKGAV